MSAFLFLFFLRMYIYIYFPPGESVSFPFDRSTITFNLITVAFLYTSSLPPILRTPASVPNIALMNIMACRIFRNTILGLPGENHMSSSLISREIRAIHPVVSFTLRQEGPGNGIKQGQNTQINIAGADDKGLINASAMV